MKRKIKRYQLEYKKTISYFIEHIQCEKTLSKKVIKKINFEKGNFFTYLPLDANISRLYEFSYGGIISPILFGNQTYKVQGVSEKFHPQQVKTMSEECSEFISEYLQSEKESCAVIENYLLESTSSYASIENVKMLPFNNEVYFFLQKKNSIKDICKTIRVSTEIWHSLFLLISTGAPSTLNNESFDDICDQTQFVITGAYDGEGYIFWEKIL